MPFTPFHMGPGCAVKAILGRHFSLMVFGFSQVVMDLEVLIRLFGNIRPLHGPSHSYLGATTLGLVSLFVGRPVCQRLLNYWKTGADGPGSRFLDWLRGPVVIGWPAAISGAFIGTFSHVLIDCIPNPDMRPFWPLHERNGLLELVSIERLHLFCVLGGVVGCVGLVGVYALFGQEGPTEGA